MSFTSLGLIDRILQGVAEAGYEKPTEIQRLAIPPALEGRDVLGRAQTGTGKTAAFALPILQRLITTPAAAAEAEHAAHEARRRGRHRPAGPPRFVRALVVTPTRELALQIEEAFKTYASHLDVRTLTVYGGVRIDKQIRRLDAGVDVVIATPGRLLDHVRRRTIDLRNVEIFVLDEVDRMFDMGFIQDVREIVRQLPRKRQTLLFSATVPDAVKRLARSIQKDVVLVEVGDQHNPVETVTQHVYPTQRDRKLELVRRIIAEEDLDQALIFCGTRDAAHFVAARLRFSGIDAVELHSNLSQKDRQKALEGFRRGEHRVLVATDVAARGLDIEGISHVINYDVPRYPEDYIHRIGRTGRAESTGDAITLVGYEEEEFLRRIEEFIGRKFERKRYRDFDHGIVKMDDSRPSRGRRSMVRGRRSGKRRYV